MAILDEPIVIDDVVEENSYTVIPEGWYEAEITNADIRVSKSGLGQYINIQYKIIGPTHSGAVVFNKVHIKNANPKAEEIGRQQIGAICRSIGIKKHITDTDELLGHRLRIKVVIKKQEDYEPINDVRGWKPIENVSKQNNTVSNQNITSSAPEDKASPPWLNKLKGNAVPF